MKGGQALPIKLASLWAMNRILILLGKLWKLGESEHLTVSLSEGHCSWNLCTRFHQCICVECFMRGDGLTLHRLQKPEELSSKNARAAI